MLNNFMNFLNKVKRNSTMFIVVLTILIVIAGWASAIILSSCAESYADTVVFGSIYTAEDENDSMAEAFAVKDGKYVYVGDKPL